MESGVVRSQSAIGRAREAGSMRPFDFGSNVPWTNVPEAASVNLIVVRETVKLE